MNLPNIHMAHVRKLLSTGSNLYQQIESILRWIISPTKRIRTIFKVLRPEVWIIRGTEVSSGQELGIIYAGRELDRNYFANLAFDNSCSYWNLNKQWLWNVIKLARQYRKNCQLVVTEVPHMFRINFQKTKGFYIPTWISGRIDTSNENVLLFKHRNTSLKSDVNKIRKNNLEFVVTTKVSELYSFYHNMYVPYLTKSHGDKAIVMPYKSMNREFLRNGAINELVLVRKGREHIAGILLGRTGDNAHLGSLGVKDGDLRHVRDGVVGALVYYSVNYLSERGISKLSLGKSRAFLKDGVLNYKDKWHQEVYHKKGAFFFVKILSDKESLRAFLQNNPFIYKDGNQLRGAIFVPQDKALTAKYFKNISRNYDKYGLSGLTVYQFGAIENDSSISIPKESTDRITVNSLKQIL